MSLKTHTYNNDTGFIRLDGEDIVSGEIDIHSAITTLEGTKSVLDYLLKKEDSSLAKYKNINYPVKTREGSWEVLIPFGGIAVTAATMLVIRPVSAGLTEYAKEIGKSKAVKGIDNKTNKESFEKAFENLLIIIKIAQHLGVVDNKRNLNVRIQGKAALLLNEQGNVLSTTMEEIKLYQECPDKQLLKLASVVTDYRTVSVGFKRNDQVHEVVIDRETKEIFCPDEEAQLPILPELQHGEHVKLKGYVSRGNQITNTIGFKYSDHVITCEPSEALITDYINAHYKQCELTGTVVRTSKAEVVNGKRDRPKIIFDELVVIGNAPQQVSMFIEPAIA